MSKDPGKTSWLLIEELFERGDPAFVDELRRCHDAERLGQFATRWHADPRSTARACLLDYLGQPLNAFRHEPLVKRLFKLAEAAQDDEVMGRFLVLFDRSIRRVKPRAVVRSERRAVDSLEEAQALLRQWDAEGADTTTQYDAGGRFAVVAYWYPKENRWASETVNTQQEADALIARWKAEGAQATHCSDQGGRYQVSALWFAERIRQPHDTTMPRGKTVTEYRNPRTGETIRYTDLQTRLGVRSLPPEGPQALSEKVRKEFDRWRLFSVHTRYYLRRRAWRYFRQLGKTAPARYVHAVIAALKVYEDQDVGTGLALIDNWGLVHILFHGCAALEARANGWTLAPGHTLSELVPAPAFEPLWKAAPRALLELIKEARCRPVRQWAIHLIRRDPATLANLALEELLGLLSHEDPDVVSLAAEALASARGLETVSLDRWLALLETPNPAALEALCALMQSHLQAEQVSLAQAVRVAASRPLPVARLGLHWLRSKQPAGEEDCQALLGLAEAQAEPLRLEIIRWARGVLSAAPQFQPAWVLEYLDSRHADVRAEGWAWFQEQPRARDDVDLWRRVLETPYDDVRLLLIAELEKRVAVPGMDLADAAALDAELLRFLWASVLLNIHRGGRKKPLVVRQLVRRLSRRPEDAEQLLPILSVALRSVRGPEWRAGLAGVVQLVEQNPALEAVLQARFPELNLVGTGT